jgi:hypothetical protein
LPLAPPLTLNEPATALTETKLSEPNSVLSMRRSVPLTVALTPVAVVTELMPAATALTVVPEAKLSCSVPVLPAISIVTLSVRLPLLYVMLPVCALAVTCTTTLTLPPSGTRAAFTRTLSKLVLVTPLVV